MVMWYIDCVLEIVEFVVDFCGCGVVGFDIVGFEDGFLFLNYCVVFDYFVENFFFVIVYVGEVVGFVLICFVFFDGCVLCFGYGVCIVEDF